MTDFTVVDGFARIQDPGLYATWLDRDDYKAAVAEAETPERTAIKRLLIEFEADLARLVRDGAVADGIAEVVDRHVAEDYVQHDPNVPGAGRDGLIEHFGHMPAGGPTPPPVVSVILDGDLACLVMKEPTPDPLAPGEFYDWHILTLFRVRDGRLVEHWSTFRKMVPGQGMP